MPGKRPHGGGKPQRGFSGKPSRDKSSRDNPSRDWKKKPGDASARPGSKSRPFEKSFERKKSDRPAAKPRPFDKPVERHKADRPARPARQERPSSPALNIRPSLWGVHAVTEAWLNPDRRIEGFATTEQALQEFQPVLARARAAGLTRPTPQIVPRESIERALPRDAVHQGLALSCAPLEEVFIHDLIVRGSNAERAVVVILDQVTDPHNVGAVLRSCSAFGAIGLVMQSRHAPEITGTLAKAACGAVEHVPIAYETNLSRALNALQDEGYTAIALDERGDVTLPLQQVPAKAVLVLGAEGRGLRQNLREHCNIVARLPTQGAIGSLNVSNAAAVALYALVAG